MSGGERCGPAYPDTPHVIDALNWCVLLSPRFWSSLLVLLVLSTFNNMGSAASKPARRLAKTAPPGWAGARTPSPAEHTPSPRPAMPLASETKTEGQPYRNTSVESVAYGRMKPS